MLSAIRISLVCGYRCRSSRTMTRMSLVNPSVPGHNPRLRVAPKPRRSGANRAIPALAKSGPGYSHASRLSFMPCKASTMVSGVLAGSHSRYGSSVPSGIMKLSAVSVGLSTIGPRSRDLRDTAGQRENG